MLSRIGRVAIVMGNDTIVDVHTRRLIKERDKNMLNLIPPKLNLPTVELDLLSDWKNYGSGYHPLQMSIVDGIVYIQGVITQVISGPLPTQSDIAHIPSQYAPKLRKLTSAYAFTGLGRIDLTEQGILICGDYDGGWISVDITYPLGE